MDCATYFYEYDAVFYDRDGLILFVERLHYEKDVPIELQSGCVDYYLAAQYGRILIYKPFE